MAGSSAACGHRAAGVSAGRRGHAAGRVFRERAYHADAGDAHAACGAWPDRGRRRESEPAAPRYNPRTPASGYSAAALSPIGLHASARTMAGVPDGAQGMRPRMHVTTESTPPSALPDAFTLYRAGRHADAEDAFRRVLSTHPGQAEALHGLSLVLEATGRIAAALAIAGDAAAAEPGRPGLHYAHGLMHLAQGHAAEAEAAFGTAVRLKPDFFQAWNNLGLALEDQGRADEACRCFERVLLIEVDHAGARNNLARALLALGRDDDALACLAHNAAAAPGNPDCQANLGRQLLRMRRHEEALACFERVCAMDARHGRAQKDRAEALIGLCRLDVARAALEEAVAADPSFVDASYRLAWVHAQMNDADGAAAVHGCMLARDPSDWHARLGAALTLPIIPADRDALRQARLRFAAGLDRLAAADPGLAAGADPAVRARQLEWDNFYLAYQGEDDVLLQAKYARMLHGLLAQCAADLPAPGSRAPARGARLRIGFASAFFRDCTVGHYFKSWIADLDGSRFEKFVYALEAGNDGVGDAIRRAADRHVRLPGDLRAAAARIRADDLDILVYPELGMHGRTFALAGLRLAPVQCAGWGHPVTTGHPTIDCFLSSALMEPAAAQDHYTERLVRLPGLGTSYTPPALAPRRSRAEFGLPADRHLYLLPQSLFKIHPDNDDVVAELLARDADGRLVLFEGENAWQTSAFRQRLDCALARWRVDPARVIVLQLRPRIDYLEVNRLCDVMLDTLRWSGGNTTLDALAVGLPVVTQWGEFMRGRQSAGMLDALGRGDLIATDRPDYVRIALEIARSPDRRESLRAAIVAAHGRLFGDAAPIRALEDFFASVARR
jgi:CRISPR-associated protein Csy1